jgi:hypothetical protein
LQEAVTSAHETSDRFNQEVMKEFRVFQDSKAVELKEILNDVADGNIAMYKKSIQDWENMIPFVRPRPISLSDSLPTWGLAPFRFDYSYVSPFVLVSLNGFVSILNNAHPTTTTTTTTTTTKPHL